MAADDADLRAGLIGALTIGIGTIIGRHLLRLDGLRDAAPERITASLTQRPSASPKGSGQASFVGIVA